MRNPSASLVTAGRWMTCALAALVLTACGGGGGGGGGGGMTPTFTVGGSITGLSASGLTLDNNGGDTLTVASGATTFTFSTALQSGTAYAVTVATQPTGETCTVSSGSGTVSANVTSVAVACTANPTFTVGGTISGLTVSGLTLNDNGGDALTLAAGATSFTFSTALASGAAYNVTVASQPTGETCTPSANTGTASANVTTVAISCVDSGVTVSTLAGSLTGAAGDTNSNTGTDALLNTPDGVAVDSSGNVYVAEYGNNDIRKITPLGAVSLFAGSSTAVAGHADGTGSAASFNNPTGVAVDSSGNVYVADESNNEIRKITPGGDVSTFAGSTTKGIGDGTGAGAHFHFPNGIAIDSSGNLWVTDSGNNEIRKITTPGAVVTTPYGSVTGVPGRTNASGNSATFNTPSAIAVDSSGNLYVADRGNNEIRKIDTTSNMVSLFAGSSGGTAGSGNNAVGTSATFDAPSGIAIDSSGNLYVSDTNNFEIRMIVPTGTNAVSTYAGATSAGYVNDVSGKARFNYPFGIAVDSYGNLYIGDSANNSIREIAP